MEATYEAGVLSARRENTVQIPHGSVIMLHIRSSIAVYRSGNGGINYSQRREGESPIGILILTENR